MTNAHDELRGWLTEVVSVVADQEAITSKEWLSRQWSDAGINPIQSAALAAVALAALDVARQHPKHIDTFDFSRLQRRFDALAAAVKEGK